MSDNNMMLNIILANDYSKKDYGYRKITKENTHWITLFSDGSFQMCAYFTAYKSCDKIYDTGIIKASYSEFRILIKVLVENNL